MWVSSRLTNIAFGQTTYKNSSLVHRVLILVTLQDLFLLQNLESVHLLCVFLLYEQNFTIGALTNDGEGLEVFGGAGSSFFRFFLHSLLVLLNLLLVVFHLHRGEFEISKMVTYDRILAHRDIFGLLELHTVRLLLLWLFAALLDWLIIGGLFVNVHRLFYTNLLTIHLVGPNQLMRMGF